MISSRLISCLTETTGSFEASWYTGVARYQLHAVARRPPDVLLKNILGGCQGFPRPEAGDAYRSYIHNGHPAFALWLTLGYLPAGTFPPVADTCATLAVTHPFWLTPVHPCG